MKKIFFSLLALIGTISMNAQVANVVKVMKGNTVVATYNAHDADRVVFERIQTTGIAKRNGDIDVTWVQLWENGPKFAEYNIGAWNAHDYGSYYVWGCNLVASEFYSKPYLGNFDLDGEKDTATSLWGDNWCMPLSDDLQGLLDKCDNWWVSNYNNTGINGRIFVGRGDYATAKLFLPAAGDYNPQQDSYYDQGGWGYYWTRSSWGSFSQAAMMYFHNRWGGVEGWGRNIGRSIRPVLK